MATRKPALSTQLKTAQARIVELEKKIEAATNTSVYLTRSQEKLTREIAELNDFIDALPGSISRRGEGEYQDRSVITRIGAWLATHPR